jgi:hypothetical protein
MRQMTRTTKTVRTVLATGALLTALVAGTVKADGYETGLLDCDHTCKVETIAGKRDGFADLQMVRIILIDTSTTVSTYVSGGPGEIGFTR